MRSPDFEIFLATAPGLETVLRDEASLKGFRRATAVRGGVSVRGNWPDVWRANLWLRGANRVLARIDQFRTLNLSHLEHRAQQTPWADYLRPDTTFRVEASCAASRIYHEKAAVERVTQAIQAALAAVPDDDAAITVHLRIENNICTLSLDTSGELLHRRGYKIAPHRAPMRETLASLFLRQCGYDGREPVLDPLCGSGTFVIEAAEIAARLNPGRNRAFAFEQLATFDPDKWAAMRGVERAHTPDFACHGSDRDDAAIKAAQANAERAGVTSITSFLHRPVSEIAPPDGPPGLVITNPPYGARIGDKTKLPALYNALGRTLKTRFSGWRVGIITSEPDLAYATGLAFMPRTEPVPHGGVRIALFQTDRLS